RVVGQRAGIDHDAGRTRTFFLQEVDDVALAVALKEARLEAQRARFLAHGPVQILERSSAVDVRLALAEQIEVGSVDHAHAMQAATLMPNATARPWVTRNPVAASSAWPAVCP